MTIFELTDKIIAYCPGAKFSVWETEPPFPPEHDLSTTREVRFGLCVCWSKSNSMPCPLEEAL